MLLSRPIIQSGLWAVTAFVLTACVPTEQDAKKSSSSGQKSGQVNYTALSVQNNDVPTPDSGVSKLSVGYQHVCAIRSGNLYCWGLNSHGQIGTGKDNAGVLEGRKDPITGTKDSYQLALSPSAVISDGLVTDVAVGYEHTCVIHQGTLKCFGSNAYGQLGLGDQLEMAYTPTVVLANVAQVAARGRLTCAVTVDGKLFCFGHRLKHTGKELIAEKVSTTPKLLNTGAVVKSVSMSATHFCFLTNIGAQRCWGLNVTGEIGNGDTSGADVDTPFEVYAQKVTQTALTDGRTCSMVNGAPKCWGASLGDRKVDIAKATSGWHVPEYYPYDNVYFAKASSIKKMSAVGAFLGGDSNLYYGSLFHFDGLPKKIADGVHDFDYSERELVGCVMFKNRKVKCWGSNTFGQFGNGKRGSADDTLWYQAEDVLF